MNNRPKFKNNSGVHLLKPLFLEHTSDRTNVLYTLKRNDYKGYPSLYLLYMSENDVSEYGVATKYFDGWQHWKKLTQCAWFMEHLRDWREELEVRQMSQSLKAIQEKALSGDVHTNKYLLERGWIPKGGEQVGRPSKEKIRQEADKLFERAEDIGSDFKRIMN